MSYSFMPMTDEEIDALSLVEEGEYDFNVLKSTRKTSKAGNPMAELHIQYWDKEGKQHTLFDYLVFSQIGLNIKRIKNFCDAVGLTEQYKQGQIPEELQGLSGKCQIGIKDAQPKEGGGFYPKKNIVLDYIKITKSQHQVSIKESFIDDKVPF